MISIVAALVLTVDVHPPMPPYRRVDTVPVFGEAYEPSVAVDGDVLVAGSYTQAVAYDLATLKRLWSIKTPGDESCDGLAVGKGVVYVATSPAYRQQTSHLVALSEKTGKVLWSVPRVGEGSPLVLGPGILYLSMKPYTLSAFDLTSRRTRWTTVLAKPASDKQWSALSGRIQGLTANADGIAANCESVTTGLDPKNGKVRWRQTGSPMYRGRLVSAQGVVWVPLGKGSAGCDLKTGKTRWSSDYGCREWCDVYEGRFVGVEGGLLACLAPKTGAKRWSDRVGPDNSSGGNQYGVALGGRLFVLGMRLAAIYDPSGKKLWSGSPEEALPSPCWNDAKRLVCFDGTRLLRYQHGSEAMAPTTPAGRTALAEDMVAHFKDLDQADIKRLEALGDSAFPPVLKAFLAACAAYDAKGENSASMAAYNLYHSLGDVLTKVASKNDTQQLMAALDALKNAKPSASAKPALLSLLATYGDPKVVTPYFLREIEGVKTPGFEMYESNTYVAREYIVRSKDPLAVAFLLKALEDPKADGELRYEAYTHLADTGEEGLKAVLAARNHRRLLEPIAQRAVAGYLNAGEFGAEMKPLAEKDDSEGRHWFLLKSGVLGSDGDLWLAEKANGKWTNAYFTGVSTDGVSRWAKPAPPEPTFAGKTASELVAGAWFGALVGNAALSKDSDGDGVTDIEEKRLGTNPNSADTDGDGTPDNVDPWPNAPDRTDLSEAEQVLAAAFEARYHFDDSAGAGLFFALKGMKPFEMPGRMGAMMWVPEGAPAWSLPLQQCYEQGVAFISFQPMDQDEKKPWEERLIKWNAAHTQAEVLISTYFGGLNGTGYSVVVKKFGNDWVVVEMRQAYVS
ncbi:MAG TPA: PQQ-binding-like beta-propeller repeat protein [Fimbriimonadaceae bacterium]|nr:PQQ-binding-like beta-propeller repeat protein [Fimbriimonadaceae bacterium]